MLELTIKCALGELTAVFQSTQINCYQEEYTAWFKEFPECIVQADTVNDAIKELHKSIEIFINYKKTLNHVMSELQLRDRLCQIGNQQD